MNSEYQGVNCPTVSQLVMKKYEQLFNSMMNLEHSESRRQSWCASFSVQILVHLLTCMFTTGQQGQRTATGETTRVKAITTCSLMGSLSLAPGKRILSTCSTHLVGLLQSPPHPQFLLYLSLKFLIFFSFLILLLRITTPGI